MVLIISCLFLIRKSFTQMGHHPWPINLIISKLIWKPNPFCLIFYVIILFLSKDIWFGFRLNLKVIKLYIEHECGDISWSNDWYLKTPLGGNVITSSKILKPEKSDKIIKNTVFCLKIDISGVYAIIF